MYIEEDMTTAAADIFQSAEDLFESAMLYKFTLTAKMSSSEIYPWFSDIYECVLTGTRRPSVTAATRAQHESNAARRSGRTAGFHKQRGGRASSGLNILKP